MGEIFPALGYNLCFLTSAACARLLGRSYGAFSRSFTLPETVDPERLSADLADGVLTIRVPQQPRSKPRKITIAPRTAAPQLGDETTDKAEEK